MDEHIPATIIINISRRIAFCCTRKTNPCAAPEFLNWPIEASAARARAASFIESDGHAQ